MMPTIYSFVRTLTSLLPLSAGVVKTVLGLVDIAFNFFAVQYENKTFQRGAYAMFSITPALLLKESPLLAPQADGGYSLPGHPVQMISLALHLRNTAAASERSGQWAAVFIPFREIHDSQHYTRKAVGLA